VKTGLPGEALADAAASELRRRLPLLEGGVSLNHAGISPQPESTAIADFEKTRARLLPGEALARISGLRDEIRRLYAGLLQVTPAEIAITRHTAEGVNLIAQGFPWKNGDRIVTISVEYPSNVYPWWNLRSRGVEIVPVPEREGRVNLDELLGTIDERVRLVAISHVEFASGFCFDLERLSARCRAMGVFLFVDIAQSIGLLPIDLRLVDAAAWPTWKWLMGPIGMGGLYLAANHLESIRPIFVGSDGMVPTTDYLDYRFEFRPGAGRFEYSTENVLGLIGVAEALRRIAPLFGRETGDVVTRRVLETGDLLISRLEEEGFRLYSSRTPGERSGIFSFMTPGSPARISSRLRRGGIEVAVRGGRLRVSPHFYNNAADIERLLAAL
jgi:cysteine desulfurase/selenocysteine lyase